MPRGQGIPADLHFPPLIGYDYAPPAAQAVNNARHYPGIPRGRFDIRELNVADNQAPPDAPEQDVPRIGPLYIQQQIGGLRARLAATIAARQGNDAARNNNPPGLNPGGLINHHAANAAENHYHQAPIHHWEVSTYGELFPNAAANNIPPGANNQEEWMPPAHRANLEPQHLNDHYIQDIPKMNERIRLAQERMQEAQEKMQEARDRLAELDRNRRNRYTGPSAPL